ncbi:MAG TPA: hypothetical protein VHO69_06370, partial [Phototrophicaceae bacterium]|nr:hypothetical protein [Phototrophicaceae bacterium]
MSSAFKLETDTWRLATFAAIAAAAAVPPPLSAAAAKDLCVLCAASRLRDCSFANFALRFYPLPPPNPPSPEKSESGCRRYHQKWRFLSFP